MLVTDTLRKCPVFDGLDDNEQQLILSRMRQRRVTAGDGIFQQGDAGDTLIILIDGEAAVYFTQNNGRRIEIEPVRAGDVLGELSFLDPAPRCATAEAITDSIVREMDRKVFRSLFEQSPPIASTILSALMNIVLNRSSQLQGRIWNALGVTPSVPLPPREPKKQQRAQTQCDALEDPDIHVPAGFSLEDLKQLTEISPCKTYPIGTSFYEEGESANSCFVILKGKVRAFRLAKGDDQLLATIEGGNIVGQTALVSTTSRAATVHSVTAVTAIEVTKEAYIEIVQTQSRLALNFQERLLIDGIQQHRCILQHLNLVSGLENPDNLASSETTPPTQSPARPTTANTEIIEDGVENFRKKMALRNAQETAPVAATNDAKDSQTTHAREGTAELSQDSHQESVAEDLAASFNEWIVTLHDDDNIRFDAKENTFIIDEALPTTQSD
jgi:CRP/FNR family transcriptional regulator, cyclic AMP receptor protein